MKDHINPNRHITSMVHLRTYVQMLSSEMNLGKHIQRIKRILNAPPNVDAYHKSSLPLSCSQTSRFPRRQTYLQVLCEDSKVVPASCMSSPALSPSPPRCLRRSLARLPGTQCLPVSLLLEVGCSRSRF